MHGRISVLLFVAVGASGCVSTHVAFDHPTATEDQMLRDRYACMQQSMGYSTSGYVDQSGGGSSGAAIPNGAMLKNCMALHGYTSNPESGRLVVPPDLVVRTY
jgi:hypothetical protein